MKLKIMKKLSPNTFGSYTWNAMELNLVISSEFSSICLCAMAGLYENIGRYVYVNRGFGSCLS
jgi:hypothetical protein